MLSITGVDSEGLVKDVAGRPRPSPDPTNNIVGLGLGPSTATASQPELIHTVTDRPSESVKNSKGELLLEHEVSLRSEMLDYLSASATAFFKSQQVNEPELDFEEKRKIAENVLAQSPAQFLARFGRHVEEQHLKYFASCVADDYEVTFHLQQLHRFHCKAKKQVDVKNRRYQALKKLLSDGSYFSESEMKNRNPLLYEQLIGRYLTQREIEEREHAAMVANSTLVSVLLAQIERDQRINLCKQQLEDENCAREEVDTSDEDSDDKEHEEEMTTDNEQMSEEEGEDTDSEETKERLPINVRRKLPSHAEKELFKEEFYSYMYNSFLEGHDKEFDYSLVDFNPEFECLEFRSQDEEEKYFDSEPEMIIDDNQPITEETLSDDELDIFMKNLKPEPTLTELAGQIEEM